jgi:hypothetical protein
MNIKFLIFGLVFIFAAKVVGQKVNGIIIFNNDSVAHVTFDLNAWESDQLGIKYYDPLGNKVKLNPESAKEIRFKLKYEEIRMISCFDNLKLTKKNFFWSQKRIFLRLKTDGKLRLFIYYFIKSTPAVSNGAGGTMGGSAYGAERFILQKDNGNLFEPRWLHFKKDMKKYLSDCPTLAAKIGKIMYERDDIDFIVKDYNRCDLQYK